jgi:hypothetical protein
MKDDSTIWFLNKLTRVKETVGWRSLGLGSFSWSLCRNVSNTVLI